LVVKGNVVIKTNINILPGNNNQKRQSTGSSALFFAFAGRSFASTDSNIIIIVWSIKEARHISLLRRNHRDVTNNKQYYDNDLA
jgi:hypothetical protein